MTAEEKLEELYEEVKPRARTPEMVKNHTMCDIPGALRIHPKYMDLIANLVIERLKEGLNAKL